MSYRHNQVLYAGLLLGICFALTCSSYGEVVFYDDIGAWKAALSNDYTAIRLDRSGLKSVIGHEPVHKEMFGDILTFHKKKTGACASFDLFYRGSDLVFWAQPAYPFDMINIGGPNKTNDDWGIDIYREDTVYAVGADIADSNESSESFPETIHVYGRNYAQLGSISSTDPTLAWPKGDKMFLGVISTEPIGLIVFDEAEMDSDNIGLSSFYISSIPEQMASALNNTKRDSSRFLIYTSKNHLEDIQAISELLMGEDHKLPLVTTSWNDAIQYNPEVLVIFLDRKDIVEPDESIKQKVRNWKIIAIGDEAIMQANYLGIEIVNGASMMDSIIDFQTNTFIPGLQGSCQGMTIDLTKLNLDNIDHRFLLPWGLPVHPKDELNDYVEVIARFQKDPIYASIVCRGNHLMMGIPCPVKYWTDDYKHIFKKICFALLQAESVPFSKIQWKTVTPGHFLLKLGTFLNVEVPARKSFHFKIDKPTTFTARLKHSGSKKVMLRCSGDNGGGGERVDARNGEELLIRLDITEANIKIVADGFWKIDVANFDGVNDLTAELEMDWQR